MSTQNFFLLKNFLSLEKYLIVLRGFKSNKGL